MLNSKIWSLWFYRFFLCFNGVGQQISSNSVCFNNSLTDGLSFWFSFHTMINKYLNSWIRYLGIIIYLHILGALSYRYMGIWLLPYSTMWLQVPKFITNRSITAFHNFREKERQYLKDIFRWRFFTFKIHNENTI